MSERLKIGSYKIHPICAEVPDPTDAEYAAMAESMKARGIQKPVLVWGGEVVSGKTRVRIGTEFNLKIPTRNWNPTSKGKEAVEREIRTMLMDEDYNRRHLTTGQRAIFAAPLVTTNGVGKPALIVENSTITQTDAAASAGVSRESIIQASAVLESGSAALQEAVREGEVAVSDAAKIADLPKSEQNAALKAVENGEAKTVAAAAGKRNRRSSSNGKANGKPEREAGDDELQPEHDDSITDQLKASTPPTLRSVFAQVKEFNRLRKLVSDIKSGAANLRETEAGGWLDKQELEEHLSQIKRLIRFAAPYTECAKCRRKTDKKCTACKGRGWVTEAMHNSAFSDDDKAWLAKR